MPLAAALRALVAGPRRAALASGGDVAATSPPLHVPCLLRRCAPAAPLRNFGRLAHAPQPHLPLRSSPAAASAPPADGPNANGPAADGAAAASRLTDCFVLREEEDDVCPPDAPHDSHPATAAATMNPLPQLRRPPVVAAAAVTTTTTSPAAATTTTAPDASPAEAPAPEAQQFEWTKQWYPVYPVDCLDPSRPHPFTLLGQELVLWRDGSGAWRAFKDACPHRLAPLSEGRVEADGSLLCAYHGWRFSGTGACTAIPTCSDDAELRRATANPRSCAVAYPTRQDGGLLWVWGSGGAGAAEESAAKAPALPPEVNADGSFAPGVSGVGWTFRDLPYGHVYFIENVVDPAHVPVSHHKIAGNRYQDPAPMRMDLSRPVTMEGGFEVHVAKPFRKDVQDSTSSFVPPSHVRIQQNHHNGGKTVLALYSTPTVPGWTRHLGQQLLVEAPGGGKKGSGIAFFGAPLPRWLGHVLAAIFLHQDMVFLHHQERTVAAAGGPKYFMPTSEDKGVTAWRNWLATFSGGDVKYAPGTPPLSPRERDEDTLFDTYNAHTKKCAICQAALKRIRFASAAAIAVGAAAAALAVVSAAARAAAAAAAAAAATASAAAAAPAPVQLPLLAGGVHPAAWGVLAALAAAVWAALAKIQVLMYKYTYAHADNN